MPAVSCVEYGSTAEYDLRTPAEERSFYIHIHYLKNLQPGKPYHYRLVSVDERGRKVTSPDLTFTTKMTDGFIEVPGNLEGPPYLLDKPNSTYILTEDITAHATAIEIRGENITLDLNGHTIIYHNKTARLESFADKWMSYVHKGPVGVKNFGYSNFSLPTSGRRSERWQHRIHKFHTSLYAGC